MPDLRDKRQAKLRARKHKSNHHGHAGGVPANNATEGANLVADVAREPSDNGLKADPQEHERRPEA